VVIMSIGDVAACRICVCVYCVPSREVGRLCRVSARCKTICARHMHCATI